MARGSTCDGQEILYGRFKRRTNIWPGLIQAIQDEHAGLSRILYQALKDEKPSYDSNGAQLVKEQAEALINSSNLRFLGSKDFYFQYGLQLLAYGQKHEITTFPAQDLGQKLIEYQLSHNGPIRKSYDQLLSILSEQKIITGVSIETIATPARNNDFVRVKPTGLNHYLLDPSTTLNGPEHYTTVCGRKISLLSKQTRSANTWIAIPCHDYESYQSNCSKCHASSAKAKLAQRKLAIGEQCSNLCKLIIDSEAYQQLVKDLNGVSDYQQAFHQFMQQQFHDKLQHVTIPLQEQKIEPTIQAFQFKMLEK